MNDDPELMRVFSQLLLLSDIFSPKELENEAKSIHELLEKCGVTIVRSSCMIVDKSQIGDAMVTIARYSIEYRKKEESREKRVFVEGGLAMEEDRFGNLNISIRTKSGPTSSGIDAFHTEAVLIGGSIPPASHLTPPTVKP